MMTLLGDFAGTRDLRAVSPGTADATPSPGAKLHGVPVGGPSEAHAQSTLMTLASRLRAQIEVGDEYESAETRAIIADARYRLEQVNSALERMAEGKYGQCVDCGTQINADRLVIQPFATRCLGCQDTYDRKVRRGPSQR